jgi:hypothetical protein
MFLHIMPPKKIEKNVFTLYYGGLEYICMKKNTCNDVPKDANIFQK